MHAAFCVHGKGAFAAGVEAVSTDATT